MSSSKPRGTKLTVHLDLSQKNMKPRNPLAVAAKQRAAGAHQKSTAAKRQGQKRTLKKLLVEPEQ